MDDREPIRQLIAASARYLSREHYNDTQIETAIATVFGVAFDTAGNLYVADSFFSAVRVVKGLGVVLKE